MLPGRLQSFLLYPADKADRSALHLPRGRSYPDSLRHPDIPNPKQQPELALVGRRRSHTNF